MIILRRVFLIWFCADLAWAKEGQERWIGLSVYTMLSKYVFESKGVFGSVHDAFGAALTKAKEEQRSVIVWALCHRPDLFGV